MPACSLLFAPALLVGIPSTQIERSPTTCTQLKRLNLLFFTIFYYFYEIFVFIFTL